jgi:hypothetical protein
MSSYVSLEERVPQEHPLRRLRRLVDRILKDMSGLFDEVYSHTGRPSIPLEHLLRALLLQTLFRISGERLLVKQLDDDLLVRWSGDGCAGMGLRRMGSRPADARSQCQRGARARLRDEPATAKDKRRSLRLDQASVVCARPAIKDWRTQAMFSFAAYNLTRLLNLMWLKAV